MHHTSNLVDVTSLSDLKLQGIAGNLSDAERQRLHGSADIGGIAWMLGPLELERLRNLGLVLQLDDLDEFEKPCKYALVTKAGERVIEILAARQTELRQIAQTVRPELNRQQLVVLHACCEWKPRRFSEPRRGMPVHGRRIIVVEQLINVELLEWAEVHQALPTELGRATYQLGEECR
jgi:hypothetical protein